MSRPAFTLLVLFACLAGTFAVQAQTLPLLRYGEPVDGALGAGASIEFAFLARQGDPLIIDATTKGGEIDPFLELFAPDGVRIASDDDGGGKRNARIDGVRIPADGRYSVRVTNRAGGGGGSFALIINHAEQIIAYHGGGADSPFTLDTGYQGYQLSEPWRTTDLTYHIVNIIGGFPEGAIEQVIAESFAAWTQNTPLTFTRVQDRSAHIVIQFTRIDGSSQVLGQACPPSSPCAGSVEFDVDENWTLYEPRAFNEISFLGVATHEFGHAIGLLHSSDSSALMYPQYSPYNLQPSRDDIAGVQRLYGAGRGGVFGQPTPVPGGGDDSGESIVSAITDQVWVEFWDFEAAAGEYLTFSMEALDGGLDPLLVIIDANNNVLAYDDDSGGDLNAVIRNVRFPQSGTYTAAATRFEQVQGYTTGRYRLTMQMGFTEPPSGSAAPAPTQPHPSGGSVNAARPSAADLANTPDIAAVLDRPFADSPTPIRQSASASVRAAQPYIWSVVWCASDAPTLERGLGTISVRFAIDGVSVPANAIATTRADRDGLACAVYATLLSGWRGAGVSLTATMTLAQPVFDGFTIYSAGDYTYAISARVGG
jgi:hypothetical protein